MCTVASAQSGTLCRGDRAQRRGDRRRRVVMLAIPLQFSE
jgi:hypothetical protein